MFGLRGQLPVVPLRPYPATREGGVSEGQRDKFSQRRSISNNLSATERVSMGNVDAVFMFVFYSATRQAANPVSAANDNDHAGGMRDRPFESARKPASRASGSCLVRAPKTPQLEKVEPPGASSAVTLPRAEVNLCHGSNLRRDSTTGHFGSNNGRRNSVGRHRPRVGGAMTERLDAARPVPTIPLSLASAACGGGGEGEGKRIRGPSIACQSAFRRRALRR